MNDADNEQTPELPDDGPSLIKEGEDWVRFPMGTATRCGLKRAALRALAERQKILSINVAPQGGEKTVKLINLPSLREYLESECRRLNFGEDESAGREFLALIDAALFAGSATISTVLSTGEIAQELLWHPATRHRAQLLLIGTSSAKILLHNLAEFCPERVWRESNRTEADLWTLWRSPRADER